MTSFSPGFQGRGRRPADRLPPGQYPTEQFPVLSAGPTPKVPTATWEFTLTTERGATHRWSWEQMMALPQEETVHDIHCVTRWTRSSTPTGGASRSTPSWRTSTRAPTSPW